MMRTYFVFWDTDRGMNGNCIVEFDFHKHNVADLVKQLLESINLQRDKTKIPLPVESIVIKFITEVR